MSVTRRGDSLGMSVLWLWLCVSSCSHPKRCGSVCMFLGAGMADLRPLVEAAARAQGLGVMLPLAIPLFSGRGTKRIGTWHVEAGFESPA